jgi:hypothetical protein
MGKTEKILDKILRGTADSNFGFTDLCNLLISFGFKERIRGDHHIFAKDGVDEILNLQPIGSKAKNYQVKQVRNIILFYRLNIEGKEYDK